MSDNLVEAARKVLVKETKVDTAEAAKELTDAIKAANGWLKKKMQGGQMSGGDIANAKKMAAKIMAAIPKL